MCSCVHVFCFSCCCSSFRFPRALSPRICTHINAARPRGLRLCVLPLHHDQIVHDDALLTQPIHISEADLHAVPKPSSTSSASPTVTGDGDTAESMGKWGLFRLLRADSGVSAVDPQVANHSATTALPPTVSADVAVDADGAFITARSREACEDVDGDDRDATGGIVRAGAAWVLMSNVRCSICERVAYVRNIDRSRDAHCTCDVQLPFFNPSHDSLFCCVLFVYWSPHACSSSRRSTLHSSMYVYCVCRD
jgi:hypothetical protein